MAKPSFKKQLQERTAGPAGIPSGIPQLDPFAAHIVQPAPEPSEPEVLPPPGTAAKLPPVSEDVGPTQPAGRQLLTRTVDKEERLQQRGFHMYPQRHRQLLELAFIEERKPWQIIDEALEGYVAKHYGKSRPGGQGREV